MKIKNILASVVAAALLGSGTTSCDYLDIMPPEKAGINNTMNNYNQALGYLYIGYRGITNAFANDWRQGFNTTAGQPLPGLTLGDLQTTTDEWIMDDVQYNQGPLIRTLYTNSLSSSNNFNVYKCYSINLANVFLFLEKLDELGVPSGVVPEETAVEWRAEGKFLIAYFHYCLLRRYGPIALVDKRMGMDANISSFPGRMHYDYCVDWICKKLDEAAEDLPATRVASETGRATSTICKALKARIMLYAASPLFNGEFPYPDWTNKVETPGYGTELISKTYDRQKWVRAKEASEEALDIAINQAGRELYYGNEGNETDQMMKATYVPVDGADDNFKRAVLRMRNVMCAKEPDGNHEYIWSLIHNCGSDYNQRMVRNPIPKTSAAPNGYAAAYSTMGATLATVQRFLTKDGYQPENDPNFAKEDQWYKSAGYADDNTDASNPALRSHIINLCKNREPRFYAWLAFDGGDYGTLFRYGNSVTHINMLSSEAQGCDLVKSPRDYCPTGFPMQKWINPKSHLTSQGGASIIYSPRPYIRLAELYLNLAECNAELGNIDAALDNINVIRRRAGVAELTADMVSKSGKSIVEWARDERSIELFDEMHRYFDVRRWCKGHLMGNGQRMGLNAYVMNPTFEEFNTPCSVHLGHLYSWGDRMYLYPIDAQELYSNPQFVQSPGY